MERIELVEYLDQGGEVGSRLPDSGFGRVEWVVLSKLQPYPRPQFDGLDPNDPEDAAVFAEVDEALADRKKRNTPGKQKEIQQLIANLDACYDKIATVRKHLDDAEPILSPIDEALIPE